MSPALLHWVIFASKSGTTSMVPKGQPKHNRGCSMWVVLVLCHGEADRSRWRQFERVRASFLSMLAAGRYYRLNPACHNNAVRSPNVRYNVHRIHVNQYPYALHYRSMNDRKVLLYCTYTVLLWSTHWISITWYRWSAIYQCSTATTMWRNALRIAPVYETKQSACIRSSISSKLEAAQITKINLLLC